jgi:hypothetical protein
MSDFYREIETSLTGRRSRGLGLLGWLAMAFFVFFGLLGVAGWMGFVMVKGRVEEVLASTRESPAMMAARMLSRIDPELQVLGDQGREGAAALRDLRSGRVSSFHLQDLVEGSLRIATAEGQVSIDLRGNEEGGTLVVETPEGRTTAELSTGEEGGTLVIRSPEGEIQLGAGSEARPLPGWLPTDGMPTEVQHIYSAATGDNQAGAIAWQGERRPERILDEYAERFEDMGFEVVTQSWSERGDQLQGSLWAEDRDSGRSAFVVAAREDGGTSVLLGYGQRR